MCGLFVCGVLLLWLFRHPKGLRKEGKSGVELIWNIMSLGLVLALPQASCARVRKLNTNRFPRAESKVLP